MNKTTIQELKEKSIASLHAWIDERIDEMVENNHNLSIASIYLKRGAKNYLSRENERINEMLDNAALFICDENGIVNIETVFDDLMSIFKTMDEISFGNESIQGTIGKGIIRLTLPDNPIISFLFGNTQAVKITTDDLNELKELLMAS